MTLRYNKNLFIMTLLSILVLYLPLTTYWISISPSIISLFIQIILSIYIIIIFLLTKGKLYLGNRMKNLFILFILFSVCILFSYLNSHQAEFNIQRLNGYLLNIFSPFVITYLIICLRKINIVTFLNVSFYIGTLLSISSIHYMIINNLSIGNSTGINFLETNPILTGRLFGVHVLLCFYILFGKNRIYLKLFSIVLIFLDLVFIFTSGSRQVLVSLLILLMILSLSNVKRWTVQKVIYLSISTVLIIPLLLKLTSYLSETYLFRRLEKGLLESNSRVDLYIEAINIWLHDIKSLFIGVGIGDYRLKTVTMFEYPHNIVLETIVELGLIGAFILLLILIYPIFKVLWNKDYWLEKEIKIFFLLYLYFLIISMLSFNLNSNYYVFIFGLLLSYQIGKYDLNRKKEKFH